MKKAIVILLCFVSLVCRGEDYVLFSPSGDMKVTVHTGKELCYSLDFAGENLLGKSPLGMTLSDGTVLGRGRESAVCKNTVDENIKAVNYRTTSIRDNYNCLTVKYKGYEVQFRAYDDSFSWRFALDARKPYYVKSEKATFNFVADFPMYASYTHKYADAGLEAQFCDDFENIYSPTPLSQWDKSHFAHMPLMVEAPSGVKMVITESDLVSYPGMFLYTAGETSLEGRFAPVPDKLKVGGHNDVQLLVESRKKYIAECDGSARTFPWRVVCVATSDRDLLTNDAVYRLATACPNPSDFDWVRPGKVAWDWWNAWNLQGVPFKPGVNTQTYKYFVDFAAAHNLEYILLDEGWAVKGKNDLFAIVPEIDLPEIISYAESKGVKVWLWAGYYPFEKDLEKVCEHYSKMGIVGFKVDFFDRDDQIVEDFMLKATKVCADNHLMINFHGSHKPTGIQRRWPNIVNQEGVFGLEQMRKRTFPEYDMVKFDVLLPYIRYVAGFADYTPGAMLNYTRETFRPSKAEPGSQGTRCRQLAEYVVFDAPLNMLCDSPTKYEAEPECMRYLSAVPTVWDETVALDGKVGEYVAIARRSGDAWYIGAMTDWTERDLNLDLSILGEGDWAVAYWADGSNAAVEARDFTSGEASLPSNKHLAIHMAPGGGYAAIIKPVKHYDVCVYGATASGVMAAYSAAMQGASVLLIGADEVTGGMTTGGLGYTDIGNKQAVVGLAKDFHRRLGKHYGRLEQWVFEPHVASQILADYLAEAGLEPVLNAPLESVYSKNGRIQSADFQGFGKVRAKQYIDCTYEGDLMAKAGVSYIVGREDNSVYGETYNGSQFMDRHQFPDGIDPYVTPGCPESGLVWGVSDASLSPDGTGNSMVQAYNYRICLTDVPENMIPIERPENYDPARYELLRRLIAAQPSAASLDDYLIWSILPGRKTDINNRGGFSTDMIGANWNYPEASWPERRRIIQAHKDYTIGLLYFLGHDPSVPAELRAEVLRWGYPKDEYISTNHWTHQLYVREARRMVGEYVATQADCLNEVTPQDGIAMAAYTMDSHNCERIVVQGPDGRAMVKNEGNVEIHAGSPYPVSYRSLTPKRSECMNLLVPVCLSASHIAYGSIRMEPVFMATGQAAGIAAAMAAGGAVQDVDAQAVASKMKDDDVIIDDGDPLVAASRGWTQVVGRKGYGPSFYVHEPGFKGAATIKYAFPKGLEGEYDVYSYRYLRDDYASSADFELRCGSSVTKVHFDKKDLPLEGQTSGEWFHVGSVSLPAAVGSATARNASATRNASASLTVRATDCGLPAREDAILLIKKK